MWALVNKSDLKVIQVFELPYAGFDSEIFYSVEMQDGYNVNYLKAIEVEGSIVIIEDTAAKAQAAKDAQIALLRAQCDADIETQQLAVYGTKNQSAALATQQSWSDIEANTAMYVPMMFPTIEDATLWITPRMQAARVFAALRFQRIATRNAEIAEILA